MNHAWLAGLLNNCCMVWYGVWYGILLTARCDNESNRINRMNESNQSIHQSIILYNPMMQYYIKLNMCRFDWIQFDSLYLIDSFIHRSNSELSICWLIDWFVNWYSYKTSHKTQEVRNYGTVQKFNNNAFNISNLDCIASTIYHLPSTVRFDSIHSNIFNIPIWCRR